MTEEILNKYLNNQCTDEELKEIVHWVKYDSEKNNGKNWGYHYWSNFKENDDLLDSEQFSSLLDKIHHKINLNKRVNKSPVIMIGKWLTRAAAILLLPVLAFLFYTLSHRSEELAKYSPSVVDSLEIITPVGSQTLVQLSDGTTVLLNHGSKLKYPQKFSGNTRDVILSGEGFFKVAHNPEMPFVVKTEKLDIKALGTTFNVFAYSDENVVETTLVEGKVVVEEHGANQNVKVLGTMVPGQHVNYNKKTGQVSSSRGNIENYIAWKDGKLIFKNDSIINITKKLSRWYNVDFEFENSIITDYTYTATFVDETLLQILDLLSIATPVTYKELPRTKLPDGSFSKQKIFIGKRK